MSQTADENLASPTPDGLPDSGQGEKKNVSLLSLAIKLLGGAVGVFSVSGILYGVGFLALRSHYSFLGIWAGTPSSVSEITEEGGRFFYHLIYLPIAPLARLQWKVIAALLLLGLILDVWRRVAAGWKSSGAQSEKGRFAVLTRVHRAVPTLILALLLIVSAVLLETVWRVMEFQDVLRAPENLVPALRTAGARADLYYQILWRVLLSALIAWCCYRVFWPTAGRAQRGLIVAQWLLTAAALCLTPMTYGRLILPATGRLIQYPGIAASERLLLVGQTANTWVVWNSTSKQIELLPRTEKDRLVIGSRVDLLE